MHSRKNKWPKEKNSLDEQAAMLSYKQTNSLMKQGFPSVEETLYAAKQKSNLEPSAWTPFDKQLEKRNKIRRMLQPPTNFLIQHSRVCATVCAVIIALTLGVICPIDKTSASNTSKYAFITKGDVMICQPALWSKEVLDYASYQSSIASQSEGLTKCYSSLAEFSAEYSDVRLLYIDESIAQCVKVALNFSPLTGYVLTCQYKLDDGTPAVIRLMWGCDNLWSISAAPASQRTILSDIVLYEVVDSSDGSYGASALFEQYYLNIGIGDCSCAEEVISSLSFFPAK